MVRFKSFLQLLFLIIATTLLFNLGSGSLDAQEDVVTNSGGVSTSLSSEHSLIHIGVVLDLDSHVGAMARLSIDMALSDFYSQHPSYRTRLFFRTRDADGAIDATSAVLDLLKNEEVHGIIGPQTSKEAAFAVEIGGKAHIPVISFSASSPSLSQAQSPFFVRTTPEDSSQVKALAAIFQEFKWTEVVILHEDTEYGSRLIPRVSETFRKVGIQVPYKSAISPFSQDFEILKELNKLKTMQTRIFLVHTAMASLGSRLFALANEAGMMNEGFAWLITDSLSNQLTSMDLATVQSMEGVVGIRPYLPKSKELQEFIARWKRQVLLISKPKSLLLSTELNIYGLWAYDTVWALAMSAEKIGPTNSRFLKSNHHAWVNSSEIEDLGVSNLGPRLLQEILTTRFKGLAGEFNLVDGQLKASAFEIFNIVGKGERTVGYWTPEGGITQKLGSGNYSIKNLRTIIWPGDATVTPTGWGIPTAAMRLRVGVPLKKGFTEIVKLQKDAMKNETNNSTGFSIDLFLAAWSSLQLDILPILT